MMEMFLIIAVLISFSVYIFSKACGALFEGVLVDDARTDGTAKKACKLGIKHIISHEQNTGYGDNKKTRYDKALELGADLIIMVHPDYQYNPKRNS